jgi:hypothetical protein
VAKLIADTNIWYEIGEGARDSQSLKGGGNALVAIPTSILEIASPHADERRDTWPKRRKAAAAILHHADEIAADTESHLAGLWGLQAPGSGNLWHDICEVTAKSESAAIAEKGVEDQIKLEKKSLKVSAIQTWRQFNWKQFAEDVENAIEVHVPGYKKARAEGKYISLPKDIREQFGNALRSEEVRRAFVDSTFFRALPIGVVSRSPTAGEYTRTAPLVAPYIDAYIEYIYGCATSFAPQPNDFGDCECFIYLQGDNALVTRDKRWSAIAKSVCPAHHRDA